MKELFYFGLEAILFLIVLSVECFLIGFIIHRVSQGLRKKIAAWIGPQFFAALFFPGIMIHEISHATAAFLFLYKIEDIKLFDLKAQGGSHGHVIARPRSVFNLLFIPYLWQSMGRLFIGIAPLVLGPLFIALSFYFIVPGSSSFLQHPAIPSLPVSHWQFWFWIYLTLSTLFNIELSDADLKETWKGFSYVVLCTFLVALFSAQYNSAYKKQGLPLKYWQAVGLRNLPLIRLRK